MRPIGGSKVALTASRWFRDRRRRLVMSSATLDRDVQHATATAPAGARILVVDDEQMIVDSVATALRYEGYDVEEALGGRAALEAIAQRTPDLVVLDWM